MIKTFDKYYKSDQKAISPSSSPGFKNESAKDMIFDGKIIKLKYCLEINKFIRTPMKIDMK